MGIDAISHIIACMSENHFSGVVIHLGVIKPRGAGVAGVVELMLFAVYQFHDTDEEAGKAAIGIGHAAIVGYQMRTIAGEANFYKGPYAAMDRYDTHACRRLGLPYADVFLPTVYIGFQQGAELTVSHAGVDQYEDDIDAGYVYHPPQGVDFAAADSVMWVYRAVLSYA